MLHDMEQRMIQITVRQLKDYLDNDGIKVAGLARLSYLNPQRLSKALCGTPDGKSGVPTALSEHSVNLLEDGLHQLARELADIFIIYDTSSDKEKANGAHYSLGCVQQIKQKLKPYIMVQPFVSATLGWSDSKYQNVMSIKKSTTYGNISKEDCDSLNLRLAEVAARLDRICLTKG